MSNLVKYMHADMVGAPSLTGQIGSMLTLMEACLKDGWGQQTASSVVVAGGIATVTFGTSFPAEIMTVVLISGATPSGLNGEKKVLSASSNSLTFDATGIADGTATGTITVKMAPLGWNKVFTGTNIAVYSSPATGFLGGYLRIDDTSVQTVRVLAYEGMYDVNTGLNPYPLNAQVSGGLYWSKSSTSDATARKWLIAGDDRGFYFWVAPNTSAQLNNGQTVYFGDLIPKINGDKFASLLSGMTGVQTAGTAAVIACLAYNSISLSSGLYLPRGVNGLAGTPVSALQTSLLFGANFNTYSAQFSSQFNVNFPNGPDNGVLLSPVTILAANSLRGFLPGWYMTPQTVTNYFSHRDIVNGTDDYAGKKLMALRHAPAAQSATFVGFTFLDITGPWR